MVTTKGATTTTSQAASQKSSSAKIVRTSGVSAAQQQQEIQKEIDVREQEISTRKAEFNKFANRQGVTQAEVNQKRAKLRAREDTLRAEIAGFSKAKSRATGQFTTASLREFGIRKGDVALRKADLAQEAREQAKERLGATSETRAVVTSIPAQRLRAPDVSPSISIGPETTAKLARSKDFGLFIAGIPEKTLTFAAKAPQLFVEKTSGLLDVTSEQERRVQSALPSFARRPNTLIDAPVLQTPARVPDIGTAAFFLPAFTAESSITKLIQPRTIFRQRPPPRVDTPVKVITDPKTGRATVEARSFIPSRFQEVISPAEELFGLPSQTIKISPRKIARVLVRGRTEDGGFFGFGGIKTATESRTGPTKPIVVGSVAEETTFRLPTTSLGRRIFTRGLGDRTKGIVAVGEDTQIFSTRGLVAELTKAPGRQTTRTTGITAIKSRLGGKITQFKEGFVDVTKTLAPRRIQSAEGIIFTRDTGRGGVGNFIVGKGGFLRRGFTRQETANLAVAGKEVSGLARSVPRPRITSPKVDTPVVAGADVVQASSLAAIPTIVGGLGKVPSPFTGEGLFERTTGVVSPLFRSVRGALTKPSPETSTVLTTTPATRLPPRITVDFGRPQPGLDFTPLSADRPVTAPSQPVSPKQPSVPGVGQPQVPVQPPVQPPVVVPEVPTVPTPTRAPPVFTGLPSRPRITDSPFFGPFAAPTPGTFDFPRPRARGKRRLARTPSLLAIVGDIQAPGRLPGEETGLIARPVLRKKRKKRRK